MCELYSKRYLRGGCMIIYSHCGEMNIFKIIIEMLN